MRRLRAIATESLKANIQETSQGLFLSAGATHFRSLWTRDFAWSIPGLLAIGRSDVVQSHLETLIRFAHPETSLIPRVLETMPSSIRVGFGVLGHYLPFGLNTLPFKGPLRAEYYGEHKTISMDSNGLVTLGAIWLAEHAEAWDWFNTQTPALKKIFSFYKTKMKDGLVVQGAFEDWQDSVSREGHTFYVNVIVAVAVKKLRSLWPDYDWTPFNGIDKALHERFFDEKTGLYKTWEKTDVISLDGNLMAIDLEWIEGDQAKTLYANLKKHPLWGSKVPGVCSSPDYPKESISWTTKIVGLTHYHDRLLWSWLSALSSKVAHRMGDTKEAGRIVTAFEAVGERDKAIGEVYNSDLSLFKSGLYQSEKPFSWGSARWLEALKFMAPETF